MWSFAVVVVTKRVELKLELGDGTSWRLLAQKAFDGLVEALNLATGLRVVWRRVFEGDTQALELQLQQDLATARFAGEHGAVVAQKRGWQSEAF